LLLLAGRCAFAFDGDVRLFSEFAFQNLGRFAIELKEAPRMLQLSQAVQLHELGHVEYLPTEGKAVSRFPVRLSNGMVGGRCIDGRYKVGSAVLGRSQNVSTSVCMLLWYEDAGDGVLLGSEACDKVIAPGDVCPSYLRTSRLEMTMTPDQFRTAKVKGLVLRLSFEPGVQVPGELVERRQLTRAPTIAEPRETLADHYTVRGRLREVQVLSADFSLQLGTYKAAD